MTTNEAVDVVPETSIVIRAFNEQKFLPGLLEAIRQQTYRNVEVIVVDSGSYDRTPEIAEEHGARLVRIKSSDFTFGYSLNAGVGHSRGRFIAIVSAHTLPVHERWLESLVAPLHEDRVAMVYGRQFGTEQSKFGERNDFHRMFGSERRVLTPAQFFANNANSAVRRDLWEQYPFDEVLPGLEDIDWAKHWIERGRNVVYEPDAAIYHIHQETWRQVRRRYYREAVAAKWIGVKGRKHTPTEIVREGWYLIEDLGRAALSGALVSLAPEIARFRINKVQGTVRGLWDGAAAGDPRRREDILFDKTARAVVIRGRNHAAVEEVEIPAVKPGDVLIKVAYVGICATDVEIFDGRLGYYKSGMAHYPIVPGHELSGVVVKPGSNVSHLAHGDSVVVECIQSCLRCEACRSGNPIGCADRQEVGVIGRNGGYAEYVVVPGHYVQPIPRGTSLKRACLCEPLAVVHKGLSRLQRVWSGDESAQWAVVGGGPIGYLSAAVLTHRGHKVTVFDRDPRRLRLVGEALPQVATSDALSEIGRADAVVEATGNPEALEGVLRWGRPGSALLLLGLPYGPREFSFEDVVAYDRIIVGSVGSSAADFRAAIALLPHLNLDPLTNHILPLTDFGKAWEICRTGAQFKTLLAVDPTLEHPSAGASG